MTRATYTLAGIEGPLFFDKDGQLTFLEKDGIDYAPATVQVLPLGYERHTLFFTKLLNFLLNMWIDSHLFLLIPFLVYWTLHV